jgi:hypothetical protein
MRCCKQLSIKINAAGGSSSVAFQRNQNIFYAHDNFQISNKTSQQTNGKKMRSRGTGSLEGLGYCGPVNKELSMPN